MVRWVIARLAWPLSIGLALSFAFLTMSSNKSAPKVRTHVILVGASIGQAWNLAGWPAREHVPQFTAESVAAWSFDKSDALEDVLARPRRKFHATRTWVKSLFASPPTPPGVVILKECSSYFPGDIDEYVRQVSKWVDAIRARGIQPILATVVPVTRSRSARDRGKQESLLEFNRRIRLYGERERIPVLDLERALSGETNESFLRDEYTSGDGSHLNARAYTLLDQTLRSFLCASYRSPLTGSAKQ